MEAKNKSAWGDESMRTQDSKPGRYMVGVSICDLAEHTVRNGFDSRSLRKEKKSIGMT
ncbi:MAG: hypothetical protein J6575_05905 [Bifidobacterium sp.]|nr:hypothetical protein [Bifidobacterium sp.]